MTETVSEESVLAFLRENPSFLQQYPEFLSALPPEAAQTGNVVDFQQLMVQKLRADKKSVEDNQRLLVDNVRNNMTVQARIHAAVLRLLDARDLQEMVDILNAELPVMLEVDVIALVMEGATDLHQGETYHGIRLVEPMFVDNHLGPDRETLLQANIIGDPRIFGPAARLVKSQALVRMNIAQNVPDGLLAFGSRNPLLFTENQGTEMVSFLSDVVERLLRRFLHNIQ